MREEKLRGERRWIPVMERLTFEGNFAKIAQCRENPCPYNGSCSQRKVWERLKAYESTGLTPEDCAEYRKFEDEIIASGKTFGRLVELLKAEKEGRLLVLPCKVGDTVYYCNGKYIIDYEVIDFSVDDTGAWLMHVEHRADGNDATYGYYLDTDKIGKTVFFTREEAEKALRRAENG